MSVDGAVPLQAHQLVSLLDMLRAYAGIYSISVDELRRVEERLRVVEEHGQGNIPVPENVISVLKNALEYVITISDLCKMSGSKLRAQYALEMIDKGIKISGCAELVCSVRERIMEEVTNIQLIRIPSDSVPYYGEPLTGWDDVIEAVPETKFDIEEAGRCLALQLPTACVFHLMRVAELGLRAVARRLKVKLLKGKPVDLAEWQEILLAIEGTLKQLRNQPKTTRGRDAKITYYSEIHLQLQAFKDAWRNHVSHSRGRYDSHQAQSAYTHVQALMQRVAAGPPR